MFSILVHILIKDETNCKNKVKISNPKRVEIWYKLDCPDLLMNQADLLTAARGYKEQFIPFLQIQSELYCPTGSKSLKLHIYKESCKVNIEIKTILRCHKNTWLI